MLLCCIGSFQGTHIDTVSLPFYYNGTKENNQATKDSHLVTRTACLFFFQESKSNGHQKTKSNLSRSADNDRKLNLLNTI